MSLFDATPDAPFIQHASRRPHPEGRHVAALLVTRGRAVTAQVDPSVPGCGDLGDVQPSARLVAKFAEGRRRRQAGDDLLAEAVARAMAAKPIADIGHQIVEQLGGGS